MTDFDPEPTCTRPLLAQHDRNAIIKANDMKRVLANIDADYGNRWLPQAWCAPYLSCPLASLSLAEQEHGRTIHLRT